MSQNPLLKSIYGYYKVGEQYYLNKTEASYNASIRKEPLEWNFHKEIFAGIDWTKRPTGTLADLYRERAQQIRDKYDYVIISFSGGMDSWTVLDTFLSNGIHVDEVVTRWQRAERKFRPLSNSTEQYNVGSEYELAVRPVLKHIEKNYPDTLVTMDDFSNTIEGEFTEDLFQRCYNYQNVTSFSKYNNKSDKEQAALDANKSIAFVTGAEKTHIACRNGDFFAFFTDQSNGSDNIGREVEFFYWTPEFPLIPVLQAHELKDYLCQQTAEEFEKLSQRFAFRETYAKVCYPNFKIDTFQVKKQFGTLVWASDDWVQKYNPKYYNSWKWATGQYFDKIDEEYLTKSKEQQVLGLKLIHSPYYLVESGTTLPDFTL